MRYIALLRAIKAGVGRKKPGGPNFATLPLGKALGLPCTIRSAKTIQKLVLKFSLAGS